MKIFLDTNVLVSAFATRGLCADVLREVLISHQLIISSLLLSELKKVLSGKLDLPNHFVAETIEFIRQDAQLAEPSHLHNLNIKDKDDMLILSAALNGEAEIFVTGDRELLNLGMVKNMAIVNPRAFWEKLKE